MMEEADFKSLYDLTSRPLLSYLLRVAGEKPVADDIFQESYVRMLQSDVKTVDGAKLKSYLFTTATNLLRDHWRKSKKETRWESGEAKEGTSTRQEEQTDLRHALDSAFKLIAPQQRSLLWLAYVEGYEHREIAAMLNLKAKSVRVLLFRSKQKVQLILRSMGVKKEG